ncbi:ElyC/SanA/YdcF family protein [Parahaliea mediterranea]|uniref:YdcF family protein n=1 Tax=Parahaliea mediterranea TaxID=651086 RepID=A0A939DDG0_9GAMM|nr:YdcF family protein [Parahaliea mediterranea]
MPISFELTKWLSLLLFPLQQSMLLMALALLALFLGWRRTAGTAVAVALCWLYFCATPITADYLMGRLEADYPPLEARALPAAPALVVLGGSTRGDTSAEQGADLNAQADRLVFAAQLYHLGKAPLVLLSGGSAGHARTEARELADILQVMGVPERAMLLEGHSRNTYENGYYVAQLLAQRGVRRVLLVTSAFHMPRASAVFAAQGVEVIPAATDYQRLTHDSLLPPLLPSLSALQRTTYAIHEIVGLAVYRARGYL